jgi:hypothetical protein
LIFEERVVHVLLKRMGQKSKTNNTFNIEQLRKRNVIPFSHYLNEHLVTLFERASYHPARGNERGFIGSVSS